MLTQCMNSIINMASTTQKASSSINLTQSHISNKDWTVTSYNIWSSNLMHLFMPMEHVIASKNLLPYALYSNLATFRHSNGKQICTNTASFSIDTHTTSSSQI